MEIYGKTTPNGIFGGGNPGLVAYAIAVNNHGQAIKEGMQAIAKAIESTGKHDERIISAIEAIAEVAAVAPTGYIKLED